MRRIASAWQTVRDILTEWASTSINCQRGDHKVCRLSQRFPGYACWCDCHYRV